MSDLKKLHGWRLCFWILFSGRRYPRNKHSSLWPYFISFLYAMASLSLLAFMYLPFKYVFFIGLCGMNLLAVGLPIKEAYAYPQAGYSNLILGVFGLIFNCHFGFTIFSYHAEHCLFWMYAVGGGVAIWRHYWNAIIWKTLDDICLSSGEVVCEK